MADNLIQRLREHGIVPSRQRLAVAAYVLRTTDHPTADEVWSQVRSATAVPVLSRATVYNTLNLFVKKGLLRRLLVGGGRARFDPNTQPHHHLVDETTGRLHDLPWDTFEIRTAATLEEFHVGSLQVVAHGRHKTHGGPDQPVNL